MKQYSVAGRAGDSELAMMGEMAKTQIQEEMEEIADILAGVEGSVNLRMLNHFLNEYGVRVTSMTEMVALVQARGKFVLKTW